MARKTVLIFSAVTENKSSSQIYIKGAKKYEND